VADITRLDPADLMEASGIGPGELDLLDGSPPCQGFSTAGKRQFDDPRNALFLEFCRMLRSLRPRTFVMENVSGVAKGPMRILFREITRELRACGYDVSCRLVDASWLGVPQVRKRLIWIGTRSDLGLAAKHPVPLWRQPSVLDAIGDLIGADLAWIEQHGPVGGKRRAHDARGPSPTVSGGSAAGGPRGRLVLERDTEGRMRRGDFNPSNIREMDEPAMTLTPSWRSNLRVMAEAGGWKKDSEWPASQPLGAAMPGTRTPKITLDDGRPNKRGRRPYRRWASAEEPIGMLTLLDAQLRGRPGRRDPWRGGDRPAGTQTAFREDLAGPDGEIGAGGMHHGEYAAAEAGGARRLTARETARLQAFPDWYEFEGGRSDQQVQIGNAVPPLMAAAVAMALFESALGFSLPYYHSQEADALAGVGEDFAGPDPDGGPAHG
jgi:site-specific DNA-cytosine methylase